MQPAQIPPFLLFYSPYSLLHRCGGGGGKARYASAKKEGMEREAVASGHKGTLGISRVQFTFVSSFPI